MNEGQKDGTRESLTVDAAASRFEAMMTPEESDTVDAAPSTPPDETLESSLESDDAPAPETSEEQPSDDEAHDESESDDEQVEEQPQAPQTFRVKVDGQDVEVTLDELSKGYSRTQDYTRKTQALAEQRKAAEAEFAQVKAEREQYSTYLNALAAALAEQTAEPDWDALRQEDPAQFAATWAEHQRKQQNLQAVRTEQSRVQQLQQADQMRAFEAHVAAERAKLIEALPTWKNAETARKEKAELLEYARERGYTDAEINSVTDHRFLVMFQKALLYDKAQKARPVVQKKVEAVKVAKPGIPQSTQKREVSEHTRKKQRLAKTGRLNDAAAVFLDFID